MGQPRGVYTTSTYIRTVLLMIYTTVVSLVSAKIPAISFHVSQFPSTLAKFSMAILQHLLFACFHHFWCVLPLSNPKFNTALTSLLQGWPLGLYFCCLHFFLPLLNKRVLLLYFSLMWLFKTALTTSIYRCTWLSSTPCSLRWFFYCHSTCQGCAHTLVGGGWY